MPAVAGLGDDHVDLGSCDVYELLTAIEEIFPSDAVLRLEWPHGEMRTFLLARAGAANRALYDLPLASPALPEFERLRGTIRS